MWRKYAAAVVVAALALLTQRGFDYYDRYIRKPYVMYSDPLLQARVLEYKGEHLWPKGRGKSSSEGLSGASSPVWELNSTLTWKWHHPEGFHNTLTWGTAVDDKANIYMGGADSLRKFSPDGRAMWEYQTWPHDGNGMDAPCLWKGAVYSLTTNGIAYALDIRTGTPIWKTRVSPKSHSDNGFASCFAGTYIVASHSIGESFAERVQGLNASDGAHLWTIKPDVGVWNFGASFGDDGSFGFQDWSGKAYRHSLKDGSLIWKAGGNAGTWTDGGNTLGGNGVFYAVATRTFQNGSPGGNDPGDVWAYKWSTGEQLWHVVTPKVPNNVGAVGPLRKGAKLSYVQPIGQQVQQGSYTDVIAYDAETGVQQWIFRGPAQAGPLQRGDMEGYQVREQRIGRPLCLPNPWGGPTIDADGVVWIGNQEGQFYGLKDVNEDGEVRGPEEVTIYDTEFNFAGSGAPSIVPGMLVANSCNGLFVWRSKAEF